MGYLILTVLRMTWIVLLLLGCIVRRVMIGIILAISIAHILIMVGSTGMMVLMIIMVVSDTSH